MNQDIIFTNLGELCAPSENISTKRVKDMWYACPYETGKISGTMLVSMSNYKAEDVTLSPKLSGWYKIYVGLYGVCEHDFEVELKLSDDEATTRLSACYEKGFHDHYIEDVFWKCAKMDNQNIIIGKHLSYAGKDYAVAWFRFAPMSEQDVEQYQFEKTRKDTKRVYAANDMHNNLCFRDMKDISKWKSVVQEYVDSDVEWLAIEGLFRYQGKKFNDKYMYDGDYQKSFDEQIDNCFDMSVIKDVVSYGQKCGIKMCVSNRMTSWGFEFPSASSYDSEFKLKNKDMCCVDRDGDVTDYMSFMYDEVQDYIIEEFVELQKSGCDAIEPLFSRGWPYILFEKPFLDMFKDRYDEDARELPLDDERIVELKCEVMTNFMRKLRKRLDEVRDGNRVELHAKILFSVYDNMVAGLDIETWAKEGLVDVIVSDERRIREALPDNVRTSDGKIDIEKYHDFATTSLTPPIIYNYDSIFKPMADSKGVLQGPESQEVRILEFMEFEKKYGVKVYIEIMPRALKPMEIKEKAMAIYKAGCEHIALWDTETRAVRKCEWSMWNRIGHKDELPEFTDGEGEYYTIHRVIKVADKNVRSYHPIWAG